MIEFFERRERDYLRVWKGVYEETARAVDIPPVVSSYHTRRSPGTIFQLEFNLKDKGSPFLSPSEAVRRFRSISRVNEVPVMQERNFREISAYK